MLNISYDKCQKGLRIDTE